MRMLIWLPSGRFCSCGTVQELKEGSIKPKEIAAGELFNTYLKTIECVIDAVDAYIHKEKN